MSDLSLSKYPIHLALGGGAEREPEFNGDMAWYAGYAERHGADGVDGRLVSWGSFSQSWDVWEMHPSGGEVVLCTAGEITLVQEIDGSEVRTTLVAGEAAINEPGTWHTADVADAATCVFITSGMGTEHRPR